ncbi:MAG: hypothetical protein V1856_02705, partial [Candidatus Liptonbacteria bacterium]
MDKNGGIDIFKGMGFVSALKDVLFPARCARCREIIAAGAVCERCYLEMEPYNFLRCGNCRARLPAKEKICHKDWPFVLGAAADYKNETVQSLVKALKFDYITDAAEPLAELIFQFVQTLPDGIFNNGVIVPIPLHPARMRKRGYNQSELIAKLFAKKINLGIRTDIIARTKSTKPQSELRSQEGRVHNVENCFAIKNREA